MIKVLKANVDNMYKQIGNLSKEEKLVEPNGNARNKNTVTELKTFNDLTGGLNIAMERISKDGSIEITQTEANKQTKRMKTKQNRRQHPSIMGKYQIV